MPHDPWRFGNDSSEVDDELWRSAQELLDALLLCGWLAFSRVGIMTE
ncbi:hypothetical protein [Dactylosporangium sp. CS-033363]